MSTPLPIIAASGSSAAATSMSVLPAVSRARRAKKPAVAACNEQGVLPDMIHVVAHAL
jgi:hypothetical protein